uniref:Neural cell adhesion molecule L1-like protein n=1 Tax=Gouania willdenowi TaxID=441366 RepID=A0A8C5NF03_GOUWI
MNIEQLPTITAQSPSSLIAFPFDESFPITCEAKGNPQPAFRWTKNGVEFDPFLDPRLMKEENSGTFVIPNKGNLTEYEGSYRCYASNKLGTAISKEIEFIVPSEPKFPKETLDPVVVEEGQPFILKCDPPKGIPPLQIYWMTINLQHIEQDERVSIGLNGDLYFSHAEEKDSRRDYCCYAAFTRIRTIVQKTPMSVVCVLVFTQCLPLSLLYSFTANAIPERRPSLLTPSGDRSEVLMVKEEDLKMECIAEGLPTPQVEWVKIGHQLPAKAKLENHGKLLIVPRVEQEDSGKYVCKAKNRLGEAVHYFTVRVDESPEWQFEPESQLSMIGSDVLIKCSASGIPQPTTTWSVNGVPLHESPAANRKAFDDTIVLHNAKASDSAVYQCEASNQHGSLLSNANIMIMSKYDTFIIVIHRITMHCKVFSSPPSEITWSRDDSSESLEGPQFTVHDNGSLEIYNVEKGDAAQYTCMARNTEGFSAINAALYVKGRLLFISYMHFFSMLFSPKCVKEKDTRFQLVPHPLVSNMIQLNISHFGLFSLSFSAELDVSLPFFLFFPIILKSVKLKWIPGDDHNSSTTEFIIQFEESQWEPGNWKELLHVPGSHNSALLKLNGHVDYRFRVLGVNDVGTSLPSEPTERYKTQPAAPDKNPENIKIEGHLPHEMDINWEPLLPIEHNGPGLEYKVSYRRQDLEEDWVEHMVKRHSFVVKNTPTFVPYEIKIQTRNHQGWGPEPKIVIGYSGEDVPSAAPEDVAVEVSNGSVVKVSWIRVHKDKVHGHLVGYRINFWRLRSLLNSKKSHGDKQTLTVPGDRNYSTVPGLMPFSEYSLIVMAFNGRGNGPGSHPLNFKTPEGGRIVHTVSLLWTPPLEPNGILTGYLLEYQLFNDTEEVGAMQMVDISNPDTTKWTLRDLEPVSKYMIYLRSCTTVGCGPVISQECTTALETSEYSKNPKIQLSVHRRGDHLNQWFSNGGIHGLLFFSGLASIHGGISTQGWFIGLMCAIALLTLIVLIACFVNRNKGGKYSVKEKEDLHPDVESQGMNDDTFCEYSDNDEKPLKGSQRSLSREIKAGDSGDSLVDYGDEDAQFNEDGSFIGEYAGRKEKKMSTELKATGETPG